MQLLMLPFLSLFFLLFLFVSSLCIYMGCEGLYITGRCRGGHREGPHGEVVFLRSTSKVSSIREFLLRRLLNLSELGLGKGLLHSLTFST